jgi:hypothetical protein
MSSAKKTIKDIRRATRKHHWAEDKIERWHQTLKNRILLENYFFQEDLEARSRPSSSIITIADTIPREHRQSYSG